MGKRGNWGSKIYSNPSMLQQCKPCPPSSTISPVQVLWGAKEWPTEGWLSSRKWCGSSWRAPCTPSWRNFWIPPQARRERYTNTLSPCLPPSVSLWPSGCNLHGGWVTHERRENAKVTHTVAQCQWGFHLHAYRQTHIRKACVIKVQNSSVLYQNITRHCRLPAQQWEWTPQQQINEKPRGENKNCLPSRKLEWPSFHLLFPLV